MEKPWSCLEKISHGRSLGSSDCPSEESEASLGIFLGQTFGRILGQTRGQKALGPAAPRLFGLWSGLGCGLWFALGKSLGKLQTLPRDSLRTLGTLLGKFFPDNFCGFSTVCPRIHYMDTIPIVWSQTICHIYNMFVFWNVHILLFQGIHNNGNTQQHASLCWTRSTSTRRCLGGSVHATCAHIQATYFTSPQILINIAMLSIFSLFIAFL